MDIQQLEEFRAAALNKILLCRGLPLLRLFILHWVERAERKWDLSLCVTSLSRKCQFFPIKSQWERQRVREQRRGRRGEEKHEITEAPRAKLWYLYYWTNDSQSKLLECWRAREGSGFRSIEIRMSLTKQSKCLVPWNIDAINLWPLWFFNNTNLVNNAKSLEMYNSTALKNNLEKKVLYSTIIVSCH